MSSINPEKVAQDIIRFYGITKPSEIDIEAISLDKGVFVNDIAIIGSVARLQVKNQYGIISVDNKIRELGKRRFAIAHELGHFELHKGYSMANVCSDKDFLNWYRERIDENEANIFAAELLMPTELFRGNCPRDVPDFNMFGDLAHKFNTTLTATAFRYVEKGYFPCALIASVGGKIKWISRSYDFKYKVKAIGTSLHKFTIAGSSLEGDAIPDKPEIVDDQYWLEDTIQDRELHLYEHTISLPLYNTILSLLFVN